MSEMSASPVQWNECGARVSDHNIANFAFVKESLIFCSLRVGSLQCAVHSLDVATLLPFALSHLSRMLCDSNLFMFDECEMEGSKEKVSMKEEEKGFFSSLKRKKI